MLVRAEPLVRELYDMGQKNLYVGGSFVTAKVNPSDIDGVVHVSRSNPALRFRADQLRE